MRNYIDDLTQKMGNDIYIYICKLAGAGERKQCIQVK